MSVFYPIITILIIDDVRFIEYFRNAGPSFEKLGEKIVSLAPADILILSSGFAGAIVSGITMLVLRKKGYRMF